MLRYNTLSSLYALLRMRRKAGFYKRIAAMQCVAPTTPRQAWTQCYYLLLQALDGYHIDLDPGGCRKHGKFMDGLHSDLDPGGCRKQIGRAHV